MADTETLQSDFWKKKEIIEKNIGIKISKIS